MQGITAFVKILTILVPFTLLACSVQSKRPTLEGKITISSSLASKVGPSDVLFVFVLSEAPESRPAQNPAAPVAVLKIAPVNFPLEYKLSQDDVIFPEKRFEGSLFITARVDKDGNAKTVGKGDLEGVYKKNPARVGSGRIDLIVDQEK